ncbi:MAG: hypothetical protein HY057_03150 [Rhodospirillales bacterium]|nr:hypothetical protein [Rhodospirillales bacterium]
MSRMIDELLIETTPAWLRAAAISGGKTVDLVREPRDRAGGEGDIYLGRVVRIVAGLGAAFVDIGLARPALLDLGKTKPAEGAALVVQIVEAARGDKGARVARRISLAGVCAVLLPGEKGVAVSRRLANAGARRKPG